MSSSPITLFGILHGKLEFAIELRRRFFENRPDCIAVELPDTLKEAVLRAVRRLPLLSVIRIPESRNVYTALLIEPCDAIIEAIRLGVEHNIPVFFVDRDSGRYGFYADMYADSYFVSKVGYSKYVDLHQHVSGPLDATDELREATIAFHLLNLQKSHSNILFVGGLHHVGRIAKRLEQPCVQPIGRRHREHIEVRHLTDESSQEVLSEHGFIQTRYERLRAQGLATRFEEMDRYDLAFSLYRTASERMHAEDGESISPSAIELAVRFARNQALVRGALAPTGLELTVAARGVHSDDFAWHVWYVNNEYAFQTDSPDVSPYRLTLEELHRGVHHFHFRRKMKTRRHALRLVRQRKREPVEGAWSEGYFDSVCSHPPEDIRIEAFSGLMRKKAFGMIASELQRTMPFTVSLGDGIDLRETIRNWAHDGRIFIREERINRGQAGAVMVVFDATHDAKYPFTMTWQGEHEQESDMALFATRPELHVVGPGIGRAEYGGFLMTYPPGRMFRVFEDSYFRDAENHAERLLLAALDYSLEKDVLYIAEKPPRSKMVRRAHRMGKHILFLPLGQVSPITLRKLRAFHVLGGREVRGWAYSYIGS